MITGRIARRARGRARSDVIRGRAAAAALILAASTAASQAYAAGPPAGNLVIADAENGRVRAVAATTGTFYGQAMTKGDIYTVAGTGKHDYTGNAFFYGDGGRAVKAGLSTVGVATAPAGGLLVADFTDHRIRAIGPTGP